MITTLYLDEDLGTQYKKVDNSQSLENLNRLNIFIGENNSGKSRLLRSLFSKNNFKIELAELKTKQISDIFTNMLVELEVRFSDLGYLDVSNQNISGVIKSLKQLINDLQIIEIKNVVDVVRSLNTYLSWLKVFSATGSENRSDIFTTRDLSIVTEVFHKIFNKFRDQLTDLVPENFDYNIEKVYIPILRGLRPTQLNEQGRFSENEDNYLKRTLRDYFVGVHIKNEEIFTGLRLYEDAKKMLLGKREERNKIRRFEKFLSETFFKNQEFALIPNIEDDSLHISIGSEERPIYSLGDGIQSIIILLYPLFFNQGKNMLVFIEEPENSMHPGLQRLFIETIMHERFKSFQYFITTHSNHFLDITLDVTNTSVYSFKKMKKEEDAENVYLINNSSNQNTNILDLIGVRNSSVFLSNCTIWVEGITDRLYLKRFLEVYQNKMHANASKGKFREDFNYSFIEYSGGNITHWVFGDENLWEKIKANRISSKIFLIADKDSTEINPTSEKSKRLSHLKEVLGERLQVLKGREIENILKPSVLIKAIEGLEKDNFVNIKYDSDVVSITNYINEPLGKFIANSFQGLRRKYEADSGTIYCKLDFCRAAVDNIKSVDDLSTEGLELVERIYNFIGESN